MLVRSTRRRGFGLQCIDMRDLRSLAVDYTGTRNVSKENWVALTVLIHDLTAILTTYGIRCSRGS